jgi:predicted PurR-regulated permease PerM
MLCGGVLVATSDNVVRPWILKGHSEMHPLLALVSVFGAVNLVGATGIFLGPVIAAVFVSFLKMLALEIRRESLILPPGTNTTPPTGPK